MQLKEYVSTIETAPKFLSVVNFALLIQFVKATKMNELRAYFNNGRLHVKQL